MVEVLVAVLLTAVGVIGLVGLFRAQARSGSYSRRSAEAAILAADKMESLRTVLAPVGGGPEQLNSYGELYPGSGTGYIFFRQWTVATNVVNSENQHTMQVVVTWDDDGVNRSAVINTIRGD